MLKKNADRHFSRRELLGMALGLGGLAVGNFAQTADRTFTQSLVLGPFYPQIKPLDQDADMTVIKGRKERALGKVIQVAGKVITMKGEPVRNTMIEIWQANSKGRYTHKSDPNPAPLDENFEGYCMLRTDKEGRYRFKSIMPGAYPGMRAGVRTPHIHFQIHGAADRIVTQMFFPGEKLNETDSILQSVRNEAARNTVIAKVLEPTPDIGQGETLFGFDLVLLTG